MAKKILEQVFQEQKDLIDYTISVVQECLCTIKNEERNISTLGTQIERIKAKKEIIMDMRTDGELTKEEFLQQKAKLDRLLSRN